MTSNGVWVYVVRCLDIVEVVVWNIILAWSIGEWRIIAGINCSWENKCIPGARYFASNN